MTTRKLSEIAKTIRSKNAGVDKITFDVIFAERADYDLVRRSGVLSRAAVCRIFGIPESRITDHVEFDPALAIKFTVLRSITSSPGDADIFGSQQYGPLLDIAVPTGADDAHPRSAIMRLVLEIARAGLSPLGQVLVQFMMVWQR
jgi:hypothetical protein